MTPESQADHVDRTPGRRQELGAEPTFAPDRGLPSGSPGWLPVLRLWPTLDEAAYAAVVTRFGEGSSPSWTQFAAWLVAAGLAEPGPAPAELQLRTEWRPTLDPALDLLLDEPEFRSRLLLCSDDALRHPLLNAVADWARSAGRWDVLNDVWRQLSDNAADIPPDVLRVFADLPAPARKEYPTLTWASAVSEAAAVEAMPKRTEAFLNRVILDSALLHADWSLREDTDTAVLAGILRMIGERHLPPSGRPLDAAWRTKEEIDAYIDERSRKGQPPNRLAHSLFRVMSGRLAIFRADLRGAVAEAHWGAVLGQGPAISGVAAGIEALAHSLAGDVRESEERLILPSPDSFRFGTLAQLAAVMSTLAHGRECLQTLDRDGVETALAAINRETAAITGVWASWVGLQAMHAAIWGDPPKGLNRLFAALANQPMGAREQDEPMGGLMLGRARAILLSKVGAFGAATLCTDSIPERFRVVPMARTLLWAGQLGPAVRTMELALPDPDLLHADRLQLLLIRGAATALDGSITDDIRGDTIAAVRHLVSGRSYMAFAVLPRRARDAVLGICAPLATDPEVGARFAELLERLPEPREGDSTIGLFQLTEREAILLPLLATSESVPEIAKKLHVSVHTVRKQVATLREKFQASTRAELVRKAGSYGALR